MDGKPKEISVDEKNIILCGQLNDPILESRGKFEPTYYIMTEYDGVHYQLITYKKRGAFTFNQLPFKVKELIAEKCLEGESGAFVLIPDFQEFKGSQEEILEGGGLNLISDPINPLFNDNIVFLFCSKSLDQLPGKGNGEKISAKDINNFSKLAGKKDWRKKLSDLYQGDELKIDGKKWKTVEHYLNANKFKNGFPSFYNQFSLDSNSSISQNPFLAKAAGTKKGKYKDKQIRPTHIVIDEIYYTKLPEYIHKAYYTKFIQNPELKEILKTTGKSKLMKYSIYLRDLNFFTKKMSSYQFNALIKIRSGRRLISAKIELNKKNTNNCVVQLDEPEFGVAPGQACVFYNNYKKMIGGGWITSSEFK